MSLTSEQPFVRLEAVSKSYGSGSSTLNVLDEVELNLPQGQTTSLVGRSGSGKSTLLSLIAGLMRPDAGHVSIGGQQMDQLDDDARASLRAERIVLQSDNLIPSDRGRKRGTSHRIRLGPPFHRAGSRTVVRSRTRASDGPSSTATVRRRVAASGGCRSAGQRARPAPRTRSLGNSTPRLPRTSWK